MVSKAEASATFNALVNNNLSTAAGAAGAAAVATGTPPARNYKMIAAVVVVIALALGGGAWWWMKRKGKATGATTGTGKNFTLTPSVRGTGRPTSGNRTASVAAPGSGGKS